MTQTAQLLVGEHVRVENHISEYHQQVGVVVRLDGKAPVLYVVLFDNGVRFMFSRVALVRVRQTWLEVSDDEAQGT